MTRFPCTSATLTLVVCLLLGACSGDEGDDESQDKPSVTPTSTQSPTVSVSLPPGVELTEPGSELSFGDAATVHYAASQKLASVLSLTVERATKGRLSDLEGFNLDTPYKRNAHYFFVDVAVENLGEADLGGRDVPLNGVNEKNTLLPPVVFQSAFPTCPSRPLPKNFGRGAVYETCLVFLAPDKGRLTAVSSLTDGTVAPVTWTGEVRKPPPPRKKRDRG